MGIDDHHPASGAEELQLGPSAYRRSTKFLRARLLPREPVEPLNDPLLQGLGLDERSTIRLGT
jgi:hypothetical protein